jgi:hypothetical protein
MDFTQTSQLSQVTPYQPPKKRMQQNLSQPRTQTQGKRSEMNVFTQQDHEQLHEEAIRLRHLLQEAKDESVRMRAKLKMQEQEL